MKTFRAIFLLLAFLTLPFHTVCGQGNPTGEERKLLVQSSLFADRGEGYVACLSFVREAALDLGIFIEETPNKKETKRSVTYLDTKTGDLKKMGLILRERHKLKKNLQEQGELMLKYRKQDKKEPNLAYLGIMEGMDAPIKEEADVVGFVGGIPGQEKVYNSVSRTIKNVAAKPVTLDDYAEYFPGLRLQSFYPQNAALPLERISVTEYKVTPAKLHLDGEKADFTVSLWLDQAEKPILAEISWGTVTQNKASARLFLKLQEKMQDKLLPGSSKEEFIKRRALDSVGYTLQ